MKIQSTRRGPCRNPTFAAVIPGPSGHPKATESPLATLFQRVARGDFLSKGRRENYHLLKDLFAVDMWRGQS
jgi:hypothetical protein